MASSTHQHCFNSQPHHLTKKIILFALYALIPLALLHYLLFPLSPSKSTPPHLHSSPPQGGEHGLKTGPRKPPAPRCDYSEGQWVPDAAGPRYNGTSCGTIKEGQNCMAHGRPDTGYLHWRWRPHGCGLPPFAPAAFLELIRDKHLAFVGDSMARNQLESLLCLVSGALPAELVYKDGEESKFRRWVFRSHNATVSVFWSPFLVKGTEKSAASGLDHNKLYLDKADERWAGRLDGIDIVVLSIGHWFLHPAMYYQGEAVLGCHQCPEPNRTETGFFGVFRMAVKNTLAEVTARHGASPKDKLVVVTTFSPAHFEGEWDKAGACPKTQPYKDGEKEMQYMDNEMRKIEVEEVAAAAAAAKARGRSRVSIEALDVTKLASLRADGHPGPYMHPDPFAGGKKDRVQHDCVHWCLPGPIDTWNEILLQVVKRWKDGLR